MIDCKECYDFAHRIYTRGEIARADVQEIASQRHSLQYCVTEEDNGRIILQLENLHHFLQRIVRQSTDIQISIELHKASCCVMEMIDDLETSKN